MNHGTNKYDFSGAAYNGIVLKTGNDVILPLTDDNKTFVAYSENGKNGEWNIPDAEFDKAKVYNITCVAVIAE